MTSTTLPYGAPADRAPWCGLSKRGLSYYSGLDPADPDYLDLCEVGLCTRDCDCEQSAADRAWAQERRAMGRAA